MPPVSSTANELVIVSSSGSTFAVPDSGSTAPTTPCSVTKMISPDHAGRAETILSVAGHRLRQVVVALADECVARRVLAHYLDVAVARRDDGAVKVVEVEVAARQRSP